MRRARPAQNPLASRSAVAPLARAQGAHTGLTGALVFVPDLRRTLWCAGAERARLLRRGLMFLRSSPTVFRSPPARASALLALACGVTSAAGCSSDDESHHSKPADINVDASADAATDAARPDALPTTAAWEPKWTRHDLSTDYYAEGADIADINGDGVLDLVAGPLWYAGPDWRLGGKLSDAPSLPFQTTYSTFLLTHTGDVNGDGRADVVAIGYPGTEARWYENPGEQNTTPWPVHTIHPKAGGESATYVNLVGSEAKELVFIADNTTLGYAAPGSDPTAPWTFHPISPPGSGYTPLLHGMGVGDVDGDGLLDVLEAGGWWKQIATASEPGWERHPAAFAPPGAQGGGQMLVGDLDGDGDGDVVTSLNAHGYGLSWFEQTRANGAIAFVEHVILPDMAAPDNFSELHSLSLRDLNGDGLPDLVTGRRWYAHDHGDPLLADPAVLYWFELTRTAEGVRFVPHLIDTESGVGCNFTTGDFDGDQKPDIFITNKKGTFLFTQK